MALIYDTFLGFTSGGGYEWDSLGSGFTVQSGTKYSGGYALRIDSSSVTTAEKAWQTDTTDGHIVIFIFRVTGTSGNCIVRFTSNNTASAGLDFNIAYTAGAWRFNATDANGAGISGDNWTISADAWHCLKIYWENKDSADFVVELDGTNKNNNSAEDLYSSTYGASDGISIQSQNDSGNVFIDSITHIYGATSISEGPDSAQLLKTLDYVGDDASTEVGADTLGASGTWSDMAERPVSGTNEEFFDCGSTFEYVHETDSDTSAGHAGPSGAGDFDGNDHIRLAKGWAYGRRTNGGAGTVNIMGGNDSDGFAAFNGNLADITGVWTTANAYYESYGLTNPPLSSEHAELGIKCSATGGRDIYVQEWGVTLLVEPNPATARTKTTTLNSLLQKQGLTKTTTLNAVLQKAETLTATLNSLLEKADITETATLNAILQKAEEITTELNAVLQKAGSETTTLNAVLQKTEQLTTTLNAVLAGSDIVTTTLNAVLIKTLELTTTLNSVIQAQGIEKTTTLNAMLQSVETLTTTLNAILQKTESETTTLNAILQKNETQTTTLNSLLQTQGVEQTTTLNALVQKTNNLKTALLNTLIQAQAVELTTTLNTLAQKQGLQQTTTLNGVIQKAQTLTTTLNAILESAGASKTLTTTLNAILQSAEALTATLNALLQKQDIGKTTTVNAVLQKSESKTATLNAVLQKTERQTTTLNAILSAQGVTLAAQLNALLQAAVTITTQLDALLQKQGLTLTFNANALIQRQGLTLTTTLNGILQKTGSLSTILNALLAKENLTLTTQLSAVVVLRQALTAQLDAILQKAGITLTSTLNSVLTAATVQLHGDRLAYPSSGRRATPSAGPVATLGAGRKATVNPGSS